MSFLDTQQKALDLGFSLKSFPLRDSDNNLKSLINIPFLPHSFQIFTELFCKEIINHFEKDTQLQVKNSLGQDLQVDDLVGNFSSTSYDLNFAKLLTSRLFNNPASQLHPVILDEYSRVDWLTDNPDKLNYWVPIHVSPVFRYKSYKTGGFHDVHYDSSFYEKESPLTRTLQSGVLYLTTNPVCTRFIKDNQSNIKVLERNHKDWDCPPDRSDILGIHPSIAGTVLTFPHQIAHDVTMNESEDNRIIIRFDIFYKAIGKV